MSKSLLNITYGLWEKPFYLKRYLKDIKVYIHRIKFLLKHGYAEPFLWETYDCNIKLWRELLIKYRDNREGTPCLIASPENDEDWYKLNDKAYENLINEMLDDLDIMELDSFEYKEGIQACNKIKEEAAKRFFNKLGTIFFDLWD